MTHLHRFILSCSESKRLSCFPCTLTVVEVSFHSVWTVPWLTCPPLYDSNCSSTVSQTLRWSFDVLDPLQLIMYFENSQTYGTVSVVQYDQTHMWSYQIHWHLRLNSQVCADLKFFHRKKKWVDFKNVLMEFAFVLQSSQITGRLH